MNSVRTYGASVKCQKQINNILNKYDHDICYHIMIFIYKMNTGLRPQSSIDLEKNTFTISSLDNTDFRTKAQTGHGTVRHTQQLLFQPRYENM